MSDRIYYSEESKQQAQREKFILVGLFASMSITLGAMIALLFAPRPGDETREQLSKQVTETMKNSQKVAKTASKHLIENTEKAINSLTEAAKLNV